MAAVECCSSFHPFFLQGTDTCQGDSGGPLTVAENGEEILRISPTVRTYRTTLYKSTNVGKYSLTRQVRPDRSGELRVRLCPHHSRHLREGARLPPLDQESHR